MSKFCQNSIKPHIDCFNYQNNSKCSARYIFKATKQGAFESVFVKFLLNLGLGVLGLQSAANLELAAPLNQTGYHVKVHFHWNELSRPTCSSFSFVQMSTDSVTKEQISQSKDAKWDWFYGKRVECKEETMT